MRRTSPAPAPFTVLSSQFVDAFARWHHSDDYFAFRDLLYESFGHHAPLSDLPRVANLLRLRGYVRRCARRQRHILVLIVYRMGWLGPVFVEHEGFTS
jgi:hypothetical protein